MAIFHRRRFLACTLSSFNIHIACFCLIPQGKLLSSEGNMLITCGALQIIPPGMEFHHIIPQDGDMDGEIEGNEDHPTSPDPPIWAEVLIFSYSQYV